MYLQLLLILVVATALAIWCGWGLARLALPVALRPYAGLLTPLLGYALAIVVGYWFVWTISGLLPALAALLIGTGALNAVAWRRTGPPRLLGLLRAEWPLLLLLLATLLVGLGPLLHYGHPGIIGGGWDIETALPTVRYLERGPIASIVNAPPNPLRDLVRDPPRIGKTVGFAVFQGMVDLLTRVEAILTFVPLLAWLRALGVLAVYLLLRATFGLRRWPALLGAALTSAGALLLWTTYFNFEKQLSAWPLIPLGLLMGVAAVVPTTNDRRPTTDDRRPTAEARGSRVEGRVAVGGPWSVVRGRWSVVGATLTAAITVTAQIIAYYPAMTLWVPLAVGLAVAVLAEQALTPPLLLPRERGRGGEGLRLLGAALVVSVATALLSVPALLDYWHGFSYRYNEQITTLGVFRYIPFTDIVGLTPYLHGLADTPPTPPVAMAGLIGLAGLMLAGLLLPTMDDRRRRGEDSGDRRQETGEEETERLGSRFSVLGSFRLRWLGLLFGALAYLAWLRWWQQYPYAYMKGAAYAGFVFVGLAAAGWQALSARLPRRVQLAATILPLLLFVPIGIGQARIVAMHWDQPGLYPNDFPALLELRQRIPAGSTVTLADDARTEGVISGLAAYALDHTTVLGHVKTGYTSATGGEPDAIGEYALLPTAEDPAAWGYGAAIWRGGSYALYRRPAGVLAHLRRADVLEPGGSLTLSLGDTRLLVGSPALSGGPPPQLKLLLATLQATSLRVNGRNFTLPAGGAWLYIGAAPAELVVVLSNGGAAPLLLRAVTLVEADAGGDGVAPLRAALVASARAEVSEQVVTATLEALLPDSGPATLALDIWDSQRGLHYGWYGVELGAGTRPQTATLRLDLVSGTAQAFGGDGAPLPFGAQFAGLREGDYRARLQISAGAALLAAPGTLFEFHVGGDGAISAVGGGSLPLILTTTDRPQRQLDLRAGDDLRLLGYALDRTSARPGETLLLTLWWQALAAPGDERSVLVHLLGPSGAMVAQADGAPARGGRPTSQWQASDTVLDTHPVALPADLPPGRYTLAFGMYRWPSLERLALRDGETQLADDVVRVPITVK